MGFFLFCGTSLGMRVCWMLYIKSTVFPQYCCRNDRVIRVVFSLPRHFTISRERESKTAYKRPTLLHTPLFSISNSIFTTITTVTMSSFAMLFPQRQIPLPYHRAFNTQQQPQQQQRSTLSSQHHQQQHHQPNTPLQRSAERQNICLTAEKQSRIAQTVATGDR